MNDSTGRFGDYGCLATAISLIAPAVAGADVISQTGLDLKIGWQDGVAHGGPAFGGTNNHGLTMGDFINFSYCRLGGSSTAVFFGARDLDFRSVRPGIFPGNVGDALLAGQGATWSVDYSGRLSDLGSHITQTGTMNRFAYINLHPAYDRENGERFMLLRANQGGASRYGWISMTTFFSNDFDNSYVIITGWGYETDGSKIAAGRTAAVPGAGGLLALACGACGIRRSRKRAS